MAGNKKRDEAYDEKQATGQVHPGDVNLDADFCEKPGEPIQSNARRQEHDCPKDGGNDGKDEKRDGN